MPAGMLMPVTFFMAILFSWLQWTWAVRHRETLLPDMSEEDARAYGRGSLSALLISGAVVVLRRSSVRSRSCCSSSTVR